MVNLFVMINMGIAIVVIIHCAVWHLLMFMHVNFIMQNNMR